MAQQRSLDQVFDLQSFSHGSAFRGYGLRDPALHSALDPFLSVDHFYMSEPTFAPHPHAGFSAVTYLFGDSATAFVNHDSLGNHLEIAPGALHWTQAGSGVMHEELPWETGKVAHGLQIFVNLPSHQKREPPAVFHLQANEMPLLAIGGAEVQLVFGEYGGRAAGIQPAANATMLNVPVPPGRRIQLPVPAGLNAFLLVIKGRISVKHNGEIVTLGPDRGGSLAATGSDGMLTIASDTAAQIVLFLGKPIRESIVQGGPFVMNTQEEIVQAKRDFASGRMGRLTTAVSGNR